MPAKLSYRELEEEVARLKQTEADLSENEKKLAIIASTALDSIFIKDMEQRYSFVNAAMTRLFGCRECDLLGKRPEDIFDPKAAAVVKEVDARTYGGEEVSEIREISINGVTHFFHTIQTPIRDHRNEIIGISGIVRDITERRRLEEQLRQAQKMEAIGTLAGGIAHDFNNLLMGIQGNISLSLLDMGEGHPLYERLQTMERYVHEATNLTRQLLGLARAGKYRVEPTDLNRLIEKAASMFGRTHKEIQIQTSIGDIRPVEVDRGQMEQVFLNLLVNAWQAMPEGGRICIETKNVFLKTDLVLPHGLAPGDFVSVSIRDTGIGMDEDTAKRVFDPFFTTKEKSRGTGLGLSTVHGILKNHGGFVTVSSQKGKGTTFTIYLPASGNTVKEEIECSERLSLGTGVILLIDDEQVITSTGKEMLEALGYEVEIAQKAGHALEIFRMRKEEICLVILDMVMPGMSGGDVYMELKKIHPQVRVLLSTGYSLEGKAVRIMEQGCDGFLQKPFNLETLSRKIREIIS